MPKFWTSGEYTPEDLGEIIKITREDHLQLSIKEAAEKFGVKESTWKTSEEGKGIHAGSILKKIAEIKSLTITISVTSKE